MALVGLSHLQDIQQNGVSPVENKLRFSLCTYVHFVLAQKHISRNTWIMQANSIMWTDGYLPPGSALSDRKKSFNRAHYYYIYFLFHSSCLFEFQFFLTFYFFVLLFFLHLFADNVGVWAFLTLHWMCCFFSQYNLQYRGSSQFFPV